MAIARFVSRAVADAPLVIFGDGRQVREFTYVGDVVEATIAAADLGEPGTVYNIGGGEPLAILDVVARLEELLDRALVLEHRPAANGDQPRTEADTSRARRELGFRATTPLAQGLATQLEAVESARSRVAIGSAR
jgi:nucleoside-diphosphate-sugar epimerase